MLVWEPRKHFAYWFYTFMTKVSIRKSTKAYWSTKKCNFISKPMYDALKTQKAEGFNENMLDSVKEYDFTWEIQPFYKKNIKNY